MQLYLFTIAVAATALSFAFPLGTTAAVSASYLSQGAVIILFIFAFFKYLSNYRNAPTLLKLWPLSVILLLVFGCVLSYASDCFINDAKELFIPFAITISAYYLFNVKNKQLDKFLIFICSFGAVCGILAIINTGGMTITTLYRDLVAKNQTSPFFATLCVISFSIALNKRRWSMKVFMFFISFICLIYPIVMQCRTAMTCAIMIIIWLSFLKYRWKIIYIIPIILILVFIIWGNQIVDIFNSSFVGQKNVNDLNSLTSGRMSRNSIAFDYISNHLLVGALENTTDVDSNILSSHYEIPHMYLLWKLLKYGLLFTLPFLIIYLGIIRVSLNFAKQNIKKFQITLACILIAFITSLAEYSAPFGPGTSFILTYILFGHTMRELDISKKQR